MLIAWKPRLCVTPPAHNANYGAGSRATTRVFRLRKALCELTNRDNGLRFSDYRSGGGTDQTARTIPTFT
jgi:hypothetical protein